MNITKPTVLRRHRPTLLPLLALLAAALAGNAHAQQYLYRGMRIDPVIPPPPQPQPITQAVALGLTVRPADVGNPGALVPVLPTDGLGHPQGMSVIWSNYDGDACQLPAFSRPAGALDWNGTGNAATVRVWRLDLHAHPLPATLARAPAPVLGPPAAPAHAVVTTVAPGMTLANFQAAVAATAANWTIVPLPPAACP
ncbi:hypothetical protein [Duganella sp. HH105]|uniref:hypothetical protein n=1 Tax=Duganella sp. HH105 TaxID=1781067 RepID=UPI000877BBE3|nr:hypothetical protein [Duganella sp. HH105]OEZ62016.1 hypothetical protein DUGA6_17000 [Duganella sp. HH105]